MTIKDNKTKRKNRHFDEDFKRNALIKLESRGTASVEQVAHSVGVAASQLYDWKAKLGKQPEVVESMETENKRLRRELAQMTKERDILRKSTALFAKDYV